MAAMESDVRSATVTADGALVSGRARVRKIAWVNTASDGQIALKDGGASGTTLVNLDTGAVAGYEDCDIPGRGVLFGTDVYCDLTNCASVTVFYET